jgi:hypothetical protein
VQDIVWDSMRESPDSVQERLHSVKDSIQNSAREH